MTSTITAPLHLRTTPPPDGYNCTMTPVQAARKFSKEHPDLSGILHVIDWTRGGKGGWMKKQRDSTVFFANGLAALTRGSYQAGTHNGQCEVCGKIYIDQVIKRGEADDPEAGMILQVGENGWRTTRRAAQCYVWACPACVDEHHLTINNVSGFEYPDGFIDEQRRNPGLFRFTEWHYTHRIDLRQEPPAISELLTTGGALAATGSAIAEGA